MDKPRDVEPGAIVAFVAAFCAGAIVWLTGLYFLARLGQSFALWIGAVLVTVTMIGAVLSRGRSPVRMRDALVGLLVIAVYIALASLGR